MNAKTSYFNKKIFTHNLLQVLPFLLLMSGIMAAITLYPISHVIQQYTQSSSGSDHNTLINVLKNTLCDTTSIAIVKALMACYSFFCGVSVFRYLFQKKLCQTIHALPMKRSGLYLTNLLSGFAMLAIPFLFSILALCIYLPIKGYGAACSVLPLWFLISIGFCMIFYALSILAVMLTGHLFATPIIYFILNFGIFIGEMLLHAFVSAFYFGMRTDLVDIFSHSILTPFVHLWQTLRVQNASSFSLASYQSEGLEGLVIYAVVSLVIFAVCLLLYQIRKLEYQGDPIVFKPVQPVFLYIGVILGSIITAWILYNLSCYNMYASAYDTYTLTALIIYFMLSSIVLYFLINMLLKKTVHVFRSSYKGIAVYCCIALSLFLIMHLDVLGIEAKTPEVKELSSIYLSFDGNDFVTDDAETMQKVIDFHKSIIQEKDSIVQNTGDDLEQAFTIQLEYQLKSGDTLVRYYPILYYEQDDSTANVLEEIYQSGIQMISEPKLLLCSLETAKANIITASIGLPEPITYRDPEEDNSSTVYDIHIYRPDYPKLFQAMKTDIQENHLKSSSNNNSEQNTSYHVSLFFNKGHYLVFDVTESCENTWKVLKELIDEYELNQNIYYEGID